MSITPTQRSLKLLRDQGFTVAVVEKWNAHIRRRQDLWEFGDLLACHPRDIGALIVQTTTQANAAARVTKICRNVNALDWLACGNRIVVHGWRKVLVERGKKSRRWECDVRLVTPDMVREGIEQQRLEPQGA